MARALNKVMRRNGTVFADRYYAHILKTPTEAARAVRYVLENWRVHAERGGGTRSTSSSRPRGDSDLAAFLIGGAWRDRTADLRNAIAALSQLS